ncbi:2-phosphosulfolactate phosphatase [Olivibacter domesticus]|uniref:Probable 2-phosphosulfolactate phosphatase n=1 Tax=Olivibacter domesticus TaxID=407022 RepID=A0A1H7SJZ1_OLID1|nr:2-phosphosulfolactate phosphatase [Olivibacter domesticus]SEL72778.1 2-phosphosulfolactate phosphatase [Olivibacter domesticus]
MLDTTRKITVCLSPALLPLHDIKNSIVVVIDIFRASTSMCYGIANGAEGIIPVAEVSTCAIYKDHGYLLAAERNGEVVDGFDFGNSPFSYVEEKVKGRTIVLTTTNGTKAIHLSREAKKVVIGSFLNLSILCDWLQKQKEDILLVCAGWKDNFNLEDTIFAGAVINKLKASHQKEDDASIAAETLYNCAQPDISTYLAESAHSRRLQNLGIQKDIDFCLQVDTLNVIPVLEGDRLVELKEY